MSWRPAPTVRNPLVALRRVVERPEIEPLDPDTRAVGEHVTVPAGRPSSAEGGNPRPSSRARRGHPRPPRPLPDRPVQALITSTPVEHTPDHRPHAPGHAAAGPWSTHPGAPLTTPTLLRSSPAGHAGGSTATATGRTASVVIGLAPPPTAPRTAPPSPRPATPSPRAPEAPAAPTTPPRAPAVPPPAPVAPVAPRRLEAPVPPVTIPDALPPVTPAPKDAPAGRRTMTVIQVVAAMVTALLAWSLIDAPSLLHGAETAPRGARRTAALAVLRPLDRVSAALGIDRVSHVVDDVLHRHPPSTTAAPPALATSPAVALPAPGTKRPSSAPAATTTTAPGLPPLRMGTAADPLRVLVIGDSIGLRFGYSLANKLDAGGIVKTTVDAREGTGLTRPDAFDWNAEVRADIVQFHPELVVAMFGGNDDQDTIVNGRFIPFGSQAWTVIYGARVAGVAATVHGAGAHLLWAGLPVMRSAGLTQRLQSVMAVTKAALAGRDGAAFVDDSRALSYSAGHYTVAVPGAGGEQVIVREPDGVHLTPAGADRLADRAIGDMAQSWHLVVRTPPPAAP